LNDEEEEEENSIQTERSLPENRLAYYLQPALQSLFDEENVFFRWSNTINTESKKKV
jgi:hypothetical protein